MYRRPPNLRKKIPIFFWREGGRLYTGYSHTNPYVSNVTQQCRCSPRLTFRAWATSGVAVKKNVWTWTFCTPCFAKIDCSWLWRLYFGVLSKQISFWTLLELHLTILAYASCACCVNIKFRVHVYSVFVWISPDSLVVVAVSVCHFSFASVTTGSWYKLTIYLTFDCPISALTASCISKLA